MTSIPKYTHQDILHFIADGTPPDDLACSVGFHLMRQPVRLNGDTTPDRSYDAQVARRMLEVNYTNPFTRAPIQQHPALLPDIARQKDAQQFRAMLLGYTKVAAHLQETGQAARFGAPLLPSPAHGVTLRQIAVGQALRNGILRAIAKRPLEQPRLARHNDRLAREAHERALAALRPSMQATQQGRRAAEAAQRVADRTVATVRAPLGSTGQAGPQIAQAVEARGIDASLFEATFGRHVLGLTAELLTTPTADALRAVASKATHQQQALSDVLLFQGGAVLHAMLADHAYEALAGEAGSLSPRSTEGWHIGPVRGSQNLYLGQTHHDQANGMGLMVKPHQAAYSGGFWLNDKLHGDGRTQSGSGLAAGHWQHGVLQQGVIEHGPMEQSGTFCSAGLDGYGSVTTPDQTSDGQWRQGHLVQGRIVHEAVGRTALFGPSAAAEEQAVGRLSVGDSGNYYGALQNGLPHGFGLLIKPSQLEVGGRWQRGGLVGPGAQTLADRTQYGTWPGRGEPLRVEEEEFEASSDGE